MFFKVLKQKQKNQIVTKLTNNEAITCNIISDLPFLPFAAMAAGRPRHWKENNCKSFWLRVNCNVVYVETED